MQAANDSSDEEVETKVGSSSGRCRPSETKETKRLEGDVIAGRALTGVLLRLFLFLFFKSTPVSGCPAKTSPRAHRCAIKALAYLC